MRGGGRLPGILTAVVTAGVVGAGCAGDAPAVTNGGDPTGAAPLPQLSAVAVYGRHAAVREKVDIRLTNDSDTDVEIVSYQVSHPMFDEVPPEERESVLRAGETFMRPVSFGEPICDVTDPAGAALVVQVRTEATVVAVSVPLTDGDPGLVRAHEVACAADAASAVADLAWGEDWTIDGDAASTTFEARRVGPGTLEVDAVGDSVLFAVAPESRDPVLTLPGDEDAARVPVTFTVARCDTHALIESKTSFTFPATVVVDGAAPATVKVTAPAAGQEALQRLLTDVCGLRPAGDPS